ncbi:12244_t:CDS:2 [Rhizophagus irregularis]|nr:12244_t:CDS:2 [Rhizophagus irregularis]
MNPVFVMVKINSCMKALYLVQIAAKQELPLQNNEADSGNFLKATPRTLINTKQLKQAENKRLDLTQQKLLGPEFTKGCHPNTIYTSRSLRFKIIDSKSSSIKSMIFDILKQDKLEKSKPFFRTILSQLPDDSKKILAGRNIKIEPPKPLFDYVSHLRYINHTYSADDDKFIQLISSLTELCKSIEKVDINLTCSNPTGISKFFQAQLRLKSIIIRDNVNESNNTSLEKQYGMIGDAIVEKRDLTYLDLTIENNVSFYNNLLTNLTKLRKLVLYDSRYRNVTVHKQLKFDNFSQLQVLQIGISFSVAVKIIQATKNTIQVIWLDKGNQESEEQIALLIRSITEHCRKLKYLKTYLKDENLEDFKQLLLNCKYLEGLYIFRGSIYNDEDGKKLLDVLADAAQENLYKFQLHYCYFKIDTLDNFFKKWKGKKGRKPLYLYPILANYYETRYLSREEFNKNKKRFNEMIERYKKDKTIKIFENSKDFMFINDFEF